MCGLVGVAGSEPQTERNRLSASTKALHHRGPDGAGEWWSDDGKVGLAHTRLAIIDLSPAGHQPMHDESGQITVVFNGEIYNFRELRMELQEFGHRFRSNSDTEVLINGYLQWGREFVSHLNGMFAFALHDQRTNRIMFARDRAGEKPLFYHWANGTIHFASELKALLANPALPRRIDPGSLESYLLLGFVPGDGCILRGFRKLPPAHAMEFDLASGDARVWAYWCLPDHAPEENDVLLLGELEALIDDAVGRQLIADVPVGILLSGGLDSSLITAMAARHASEIRTFTVGFIGSGPHNEIPHARLIAHHFGTRHTELVAEPASIELLGKLAAQFDEPIIDSSLLPTFHICELVKQYCTVALGGDGGDELFAGYGHYSRLLTMQKHYGQVPQAVRSLAAAAGTFLPTGFRGRNWLRTLDTDFDHGLPMPGNHFDVLSRRRLMPQYTHPIVAESTWRDRIPAATDLVERASRMDFANYLPEDILVKVDRASMLTSLEVRAPFLDHRLIEFSFAKVPTRLKATSNAKKILLKRLAAKVLPPGFDLQRKQGFSLPLADWLKAGPFREACWSILTDGDLVFDRRFVKQLLEGQDAGRSNSERLFGLVMFELWRRHYGVTV
jgi:asparagine synthase (glutamine-hydrolysing)